MSAPARTLPRLPAGGELNALIAMRVMGWEARPFALGKAWFTRDGALAADERWSPSCEIGAAMQVVDELHRRLFAHANSKPGTMPMPWDGANYLELSCLGFEDGYAAAFVSIDDVDWICQERFGIAIAKTAPLAICYAALDVAGGV